MVTEISIHGSKLAVVRGVSLFSKLTDVELTQLLEGSTNMQFEEHTNVVIEGELSWGLYIIIEGTVGIFRNNQATGEVYDVGQLTTGSFFGEMSLIDEAPRSATVKAITPLSVVHIPKDAFYAFLSRSAELKTRFYKSCVETLVSRLRTLDDSYVTSQYQLWKRALKKEVA